MDPVLSEALQGVLRHILTAGGGALVAAGYATNDQVTAIVTALIGVVSFFVGVGWSWWQKRQAERSKQVAVVAATVGSATGQRPTVLP